MEQGHAAEDAAPVPMTKLRADAAPFFPSWPILGVAPGDGAEGPADVRIFAWWEVSRVGAVSSSAQSLSCPRIFLGTTVSAVAEAANYSVFLVL